MTQNFLPEATSWTIRGCRGHSNFMEPVSDGVSSSLLLGLDKEHRQLACGLVDTIGMGDFGHSFVISNIFLPYSGSYTFAKTLEYKAKQGLTGGSGREITVVPPNEYQDRFVKAMEGYFIACPGSYLDHFRCRILLTPWRSNQTSGAKVLRHSTTAAIWRACLRFYDSRFNASTILLQCLLLTQCMNFKPIIFLRSP